MSFIASALFVVEGVADVVAGSVTAAGVAEGATVVGAGVSAYGQYQSGQNTQKVDEYNASVQRQNALEVSNKAKMAAENKEAEGDSLMARQRVLYAKSGVAQEGTPTELIIGTAGDVEDDAQTILQKGRFEYEAGMESAEISEAEGGSAAQGGTLSAGGTLFSGLSRAGVMASNNLSPTIPTG
jgi:hypothetical protein